MKKTNIAKKVALSVLASGTILSCGMPVCFAEPADAFPTADSDENQIAALAEESKNNCQILSGILEKEGKVPRWMINSWNLSMHNVNSLRITARASKTREFSVKILNARGQVVDQDHKSDWIETDKGTILDFRTVNLLKGKISLMLTNRTKKKISYLVKVEENDGLTVGLPKIRKVMALKNGKAKITYSKASNAEHYEILYSKGSDKWKKVKAYGTSKTVSGLDKGKTYAFKVKAVNGCVKGVSSNIRTVKIK